MNGRNQFSKTAIKATFKRLNPIDGLDLNLWRKDAKGRTINVAAYGNDKSQYGWNIHHINFDSSVETINETFDNLEAISFESHKEIHANPEEKNRIKAVNYIISEEWKEFDSDGFSIDTFLIDMPAGIKLEGYSDNGFKMSKEIALELLIDHIKKGRK